MLICDRELPEVMINLIGLYWESVFLTVLVLFYRTLEQADNICGQSEHSLLHNIQYGNDFKRPSLI